MLSHYMSGSDVVALHVRELCCHITYQVVMLSHYMSGSDVVTLHVRL
jgi:hypothetical protein